MSNASILHPHTTASAAAAGARVRGGLEWQGLPGMAASLAPYPIDRGVSR